MGPFIHRRLFASIVCAAVAIGVMVGGSRLLTQTGSAPVVQSTAQAPSDSHPFLGARVAGYFQAPGHLAKPNKVQKKPAKHASKTVIAKRELPKVVNGRLEEDEGNPGSVESTNPLRAWKWRRLSYLDENGHFPTDGFSRALSHRKHLVDGTAMRSSGIQWIDRGPNNVAGRTRSLLIHPTQTNRMWAGSVGGGIWYSQDRGATWVAVNDFMKNLAISSMAMDPQNPSTMYAGTGEGYFNGDAIRGAGIFKSIDGGVTWSQIPSTAPWGAVNRIAVSPSDSNVLLAGVNPGGIFRSTNAGATWVNVKSAAIMGVTVAFNPLDGTKAIATIFDADSTFFYSSIYSTDAGQTWQASTGGLERQVSFDRTELTYVSSNPNLVFALNGGDGGKIWKSTDGGHSYAAQTTVSPNLNQLWYDNTIWVDPTNTNRIIIGGSALLRSDDGGKTVYQIANGYLPPPATDPHPDVHFVMNDPGYDGITNKRVYITTDGGVYYTDDISTANIGTGWGQLRTTNRTSQLYSADGDGKTGVIYGGLQDNGSQMLKPGSDNAIEVFGGDGGFCAVDPTNNNFLYGEYVGLTVHRSTDGGVTADFILNGLNDAFYNANFIAPFILDPNNANRLLGGGASLWRTNNAKDVNAGPVWSEVRPPSTDYISAIAIAPRNSNIVWVGQNDGGIARTASGTAANPKWVTVSGSGTPLPHRYVERITIDPADSRIVYVGFGGFSRNNLWKTTDGGGRWVSVTGSGATGLPDAPVRGIARHPDDPNILYVGTEVGVFVTYDGGRNWSANDFGPAAVSVDELKFMADSKILVAATHGRGVFTADVTLKPNNKPTIQPIAPITTDELVAMTFTAHATDPDVGQTIRFGISNAPLGATISSDGVFSWTPSEVQGPGTYNITVTALDNGAPAKSDSTVVTITVNDVNSPPVLTAISDQTVKAGGSTSIALHAVDTDIPVNILTCSVQASPSWATVSGKTLTLAPPANIALGNYVVRVRVTDNGKNPSNLWDEKPVNVKVTAAVLQSISLNPNPSESGKIITGTVKLDGIAPASGVVVTLTSDNTVLAPVPASVTVPGGSSQATFTFTAGTVDQPVTMHITGQLDTISQTVAFVVAPAGLASITVNPSTVTGGDGTQMTISLTFPAPPNGVLVSVATDSPYLITPTTVLFLPGQTSVTLSLLSRRVRYVQLATITATLGSQQVSCVLTINPFSIGVGD